MLESTSEVAAITPQETQEVPRLPDFKPEKPAERLSEEKDSFKLERQEFASQTTKLLEEKKFYFDRDEFERQLADENRRFLTLVGLRIEEGLQLPRERFFKAPMPQKDSEKQKAVDLAFRRQTLTHYYLDMNTKLPMSEVLDFNTDPDKGQMWAIMSTYEQGSGVGFLSKPEDIKQLEPRHATLAVAAIRGLSNQKEIKPELAEVLEKRPAYQNYESFLGNIINILDKQVNGAGEFYSEDKKPLHQILAERTGIPNFRDQTLHFIRKLQPVIEKAQEGIHLVHGDLAPNNLFLGDGIKAAPLMFLDFEWSGLSSNQILAEVYDFGNLRARAWNNKTFRNALDREMIDSYKAEGWEEVGRAIVALGILRSHMNLAGFFENYKPEKSSLPEQTARRKATEADIAKAWEVFGLRPNP